MPLFPVRLALVLLLALLAPAALAQLPGAPQPCGPFDLVAVGPATSVAPGAAASVSATITNEGPTDASVVVVASIESAGWTLTSPESQSVNVAAGAKQTLNITVQAAEGTTTGTLDLGGQGDCASGLPTGCPNAQLCVSQLPPQTVTFESAAPEGFRFPGLAGLDFPVEYLAAAVLLVAVAIAVPLVLRRKPRASAFLSSPEPLKRVRPGGGTSFPIEIRNPTDEPLTLALDVGPVPEGWSAYLPLPDVQLAAKETRSLWLMVRSPPDAARGQSCDVEVAATDAKSAQRLRRAIRVRAEVDEAATDAG